MSKFIAVLLVLLVLLTLSAAGDLMAQVSVGGLVDVLFKNTGNKDVTNITFKNFSNFHSTRARFFLDAAPADNLEVFTQILVDKYAFQLYGAYIRFTNIGGTQFNAQVGLIPHPVGAWGPRTYSNINPLVGVPLVYNMHSSYIPGGSTAVRVVDDILALRDLRSNSGLPVIYDACWNTGAEIYGASGKWSYSLGLLTGSVSKPTMEQSKDIPQVTTHITYNLSSRITVGGSAYIGPYLMEGAYKDSLPAGADYGEYMNGGIGYELHYSGRYLEIYSESFYAYWEHPYLPNLKLFSGYVEGKYKFSPGWYVAGRLGFYEPGELTDSQGAGRPWDYPVKRIEAGIGYHPNRRTTLKLVTQLNNFDLTDDLDSELYAFQMAVSFD